MTSESFTEKLQTVYQDIRSHSQQKVNLIAVTKTLPVDVYHLCFASALWHIGENRIEEINQKSGQMVLPQQAKLHLIGPLQSRKIKLLPPNLFSIDSISSAEHLQKVNDHFENLRQQGLRDQAVKVLLQINACNEAQKNGYLIDVPDELKKIIDLSLTLPMVEIDGFMAMGPTPRGSYDVGNAAYEFDAAKAFESVHQLIQQFRQKYGLLLPRLSMGMSHDYRLALQAGSNEIRLGSFLFGSRG